MAEFGVRATDLSQAQGAGSAPIQAVQSTNNPVPDLGLFGSLFNALGQTKAQKPYTNILNNAAGDINKILQAESTGQITARESNLQLQRTVLQYQRMGKDQGPEFVKDMAQLVGNLRVGTNYGDIEARVDAENAEFDKARASLVERGIYVAPSGQIDQDGRDLVMRQQQELNNLERLEKRSLDLADRQRQAVKEGREDADYYFKESQRQLQVEARQASGLLQANSLNYLVKTIDDLAKEPDHREAMFKYEQSVSSIRREASMLLQNDPEAMRIFNDSLDDVVKFGRQQLDPATRSKDAEDELKRVISTRALAIVQGENLALNVAAFQKIAPNTPMGDNAARALTMRYLSEDTKAISQGGAIPSVTSGNIEAQRHLYGGTKTTIDRAIAGTISDPEGGLDAGAQVAAGAMRSLGSISQTNPTTVAYTMDFLASEQHEKLLKSNRYDVEAAQAALPTFRNMVVNEFGQDFYYNFANAPISGIGNWATLQERMAPEIRDKYKSYSSFIDFQVNDKGVATIVPKVSDELRQQAGVKLTQGMEQTIVRNSRDRAKNLTSIIRAGAMLEGRTDFKQYFEENRSRILRGFYPPESELQHYKAEGYNGTGNIHNPANWKPGTSLSTARPASQGQ